MRICSNCILPESYPGIEFDTDGVCNYCTTYRRQEYKGEEELYKFLDTIRNKGRKYDCVVGVSGGRDSSYTLYYLLKKCKLRVIALTVDNGFTHEIARANMRTMLDQLGIELVVAKNDFLKKNLRHNILSWGKNPTPSMIPLICCGCRIGITRAALQFAKKNDIPLVAFGSGSPTDPPIFKQVFLTSKPLGRLLQGGRSSVTLSSANESDESIKGTARMRKVISLGLGLLYEVAKNPSYFFKPSNAVMFTKEFFYVFNLKTVRRIFYPKQKILWFYHYIEYNPEVIVPTIEREMNWKKPEDAGSSSRYDCTVSFLRNYLLRESAGFTEKVDNLSVLIRENVITRDEALERLESEDKIPRAAIDELISQIKIEPAKLNTAVEKSRKAV